MFAYPCDLETACLLTPVFWRKCACLPLCFGDSVFAYPCVLVTVCLLTPLFLGDSVLAYPCVLLYDCPPLQFSFIRFSSNQSALVQILFTVSVSSYP